MVYLHYESILTNSRFAKHSRLKYRQCTAHDFDTREFANSQTDMIDPIVVHVEGVVLPQCKTHDFTPVCRSNI